MKRFLLKLLIGLLFNTSLAFAQVPDSTIHSRMFYVCKAWGHLKYYHTEIANGNVNWDSVLVHSLNGLKSAPTNEAFNDSLFYMLSQAGVMGTSTVPLPSVPDSLNNNTDVSWMSNAIFADSVQAILDTVRIWFRPQSHVLVDEAFANGNPTFDADNSYFNTSTTSENVRILALFRYWNIINYFFPYKYIMDQTWDETLEEFVPVIMDSSSELDYHLGMKKLTTRINDTHGYFISDIFRNLDGAYHPPFLAGFIEDEMVITKVLSGHPDISVGDVITEMDGISMSVLRDSIRHYAHGSNDAAIEREINSMILFGDNGSFSFKADNGTTVSTIQSSRNSSNLGNLRINTNEMWRDTTLTNGCHVGIVDMGKLSTVLTDNMFDELWETDMIVFDIRNYPNGTIWDIAGFIYTSTVAHGQFTTPDITYPGRLSWIPTYIGTGNQNPYQGKITILFNEETQSHGEYTCMGFEAFPNLTKIGSTTAGADGNVSYIKLPGGIETIATMLGTYYPDFTPTQRVGIIPDIEVTPTILGIRNGVDEVMETALQCNFIGIESPEGDVEISLYPNPSSHILNYNINSEDLKTIEIVNIQGITLNHIHPENQQGQIDISDLKPGIYIAKIQLENALISKTFIKI